MTLWVLCQVRGPVEVTNQTTSKAQRKHGRFLSSCPSERNSRPRPLKNLKNPSQAALLVTNGLAVLNNDRCLEKCKDAFNFEVGKGKLLVCMSDLASIQDKPEGRQFYKSILDYMSSDDFQPAAKITSNELKTLFSKTVLKKSIKTIGNISYQ
jgi:hypothetical protein